MPLHSDKVQYVLGDAKLILDMDTAVPLEPFHERVMGFFSELSKKVMKNSSGYSEVATFGFWCRKASLESMKKQAGDMGDRLGRGMIFHSTPSNVPVNFAFSFAAGLLTGNANIVRLPAKDFPQVSIICSAAVELLKGPYKELEPYVCFLKYAPDKELNDLFSQMCDVRVVWGGDATIGEMRKSPLQPRALEINFADRHSICMIDADQYLMLTEQEKEKAALDFYNDTYFSDQNACTSPRLLVWLGRRKDEAKEEFWESLEKVIARKYELKPVQATGKLLAFCRAAAVQEGLRLRKKADNRLWRIQLDSLTAATMDFKYHSGYFFEYDAAEIKEIRPVCSKKCQTLSYLGLDKKMILRELSSMGVKGVDRIVPMGKTMDFSLIWDGYDLLEHMSRRIAVL